MTQEELLELQAIMELENNQGLSADEMAELQAIEQIEAKEQGQPSQAQTFLESAGKGITLGYLPQIQAGVEKATDFVSSFIPGSATNTDKKLREQGFTIDQQGDTYLEKRDQNIARQAEQAEAYPMTAMAGEVGGAIVSGIATGGLGSKVQAASRLKRIGQAAKVGAVYGALANPGDVEGELNVLQVGERAKGAVKGALTGAILQGGVESFGKARMMLKESARAKEIEQAVDTTSQVLKNTAKNIKNNIDNALNPKRVEDFDDILKVLKENNITDDISKIPESLEFGQESTLSNLSKVIRQGVGGDQKTKAFNDFLNKVDDAAYNQVSKISPKGVVDNYTAGESLVNGYNKGVNDFFKDLDLTYGSFKKVSPKHVMSPNAVKATDRILNRIERQATNLTKFGTPEQVDAAKKTIQLAQNIKNMNGTYDEYLEVMQNIGRQAYSKKPTILGQATTDQKVLKEIYNTMRKQVIREVKSVDPKLASRLIENNQKIHSFIGDQSKVSNILSKGDSSERVFKNLVKNGKIDDLEAILDVVPQETVKDLKAAFLTDLIKKDSATGRVSYKQTLNNVQAKKDILARLFADDPKSLESFQKLISTGEKTGQVILNPSGTFRSKEFKEYLSSLLYGTQDEATLEVLKQRARNAKPSSLKKIQTKEPIVIGKRPMKKPELKRVKPVDTRALTRSVIGVNRESD
jgi:hypothetical protein